VALFIGMGGSRYRNDSGSNHRTRWLRHTGIFIKAARMAFETFQNNWKQYPGAVDVWVRNFQHVEQLYDYGSAVRKVMYTTNAIESVNSSFRKVTKKGSFPNENAVFKILYLRITELQKKWDGGHYQNWSMVLNQLMVNEKFTERINKYLTY